MIANDLLLELRHMSERQITNTCDTCKAGDIDKEIHKVATCFIATPEVIRSATAWGADLLITHEPTFYNHPDNHEDNQMVREKLKIVEESGLTIVRFHDHMHTASPDLIHLGFMKMLNLPYSFMERSIVSLQKPMTPKELAIRIKENANLHHVRLVGNDAFLADKLYLGLGETNGDAILENLHTGKAQVVIAGEICEWKVCEMVRDAGQLGVPMAVLILGHAGSERDGMKALNDALAEKHSELQFRYFECGEIYQYI